MPDAEFEKTFADLAHARLRDRAPGLLDHMVGFQLLDKSDDDTHAVGVWGFQVGPEWMYAPVFFLNGQLKGDELLYIKSQDAFVPLKENWINYLLNRRPHVLGEVEPLKQTELGVSQPDFDSLARPPYTGSKSASAVDVRGLVDRLTARVSPDFRGFLSTIMSSPGGEKRAELSSKWHLPNFLKRAGRRAAVTLIMTMRKDASFSDAILKFYKMDDIIKAAELAMGTALVKKAADGDKKIEGTAPRVQVMFADRANVLDLDSSMLTDAEKEKLQADRYLVKDRRGDSEIGTVYAREIGKTLQNPNSSGYCRVVTAKGTFQPHLVILSPVGGRDQYGEDASDAVVINHEIGNRMRMMPAKNIYIGSEPHDAAAWNKIFDGLPEASTMREKDKVVFVNKSCSGTAPFFITRKVTSEDGRTTFYGDFDRYPQVGAKSDIKAHLLYPPFNGRKFNVSDAHNRWNDSPCESSGDGSISFVITGKDGKQITQVAESCFVPNGFKAIKINPQDIRRWKLEDYERDRKGETINGIKIPPRLPSPDELASPQTLADIEMQLFKSGMVTSIQPITDGIEYWLKANDRMSRAMSKVAAIAQLIERHQLREKDALALLKLASKSPPEFLIKRAQGQPNAAPAIPDPELTSDPSLGGGVPVQYPQTDLITVGSDVEQRGSDMMDMDATYRARQAAEQGQKEVMDTSVIGGLVKTMDPDAAVDNYLGDLMLGLDRIGRILFMYYWHYQKMKDRYGAQDMPELEDNLRNVFDGMGDLTLFLKQKTIEPEVSGATAEAELNEVV